MKCLKCKSSNWKTVDSREYFNNRVKRRKECLNCKHRWTTLEYIINERTKKDKPIRHCQYATCNKPTFGKGNCSKYCPDHKKQWENLRWELWRAKKKGQILMIPIEFNRGKKK